MKYLLLLLLPLAVQAQPVTYGLPLYHGSVVYREVVTLNGLTGEEIYNRTRMMANERFKNISEIMFAKKQDGKITGNGSLDINFRGEIANLIFRVHLQVRDTKYLLTIDNIELVTYYGNEAYHTRIEEQLLFAHEKRMQSTIGYLTMEDALIKNQIRLIKEDIAKPREIVSQ